MSAVTVQFPKGPLGLVLQRAASMDGGVASYEPCYHAYVHSVPTEGAACAAAHAHNVACDSPSDHVASGMSVVRVDGASTLGVAYPDVLAAIKASARRALCFARADLLAAVERTACRSAATMVVDSAGTIGIRFLAARERGVFGTLVAEVIGGGAAARHNACSAQRIERGMLLRAINGVSTAAMLHGAVCNALRNAPRPQWLSFVRGGTPLAHGASASVVDVTFDGAKSLGLHLLSQPPNVVVRAIVEGGAAAEHNAAMAAAELPEMTIRSGMRLVAVDGVTLPPGV